MVNVGDAAPKFKLMNQNGVEVSSASLKGERYVLYFYPKDDTPGCTKEACAFRDLLPDFSAINVRIFGVSADSVAAHKKFVDKYQLTFELLADPTRELIEALGFWVEKSMYGKKYMGIQRATIVVGSNGKIEHVWPKVSPEKHADEVAKFLKS
jgi:thioredoxin-dependent peroxiredoxin